MNNIIRNIRDMRFNLMELSGAMGDLGTFIPLVAAITIVSGMDIGIILIFAGIFNIVTGIIFGQPIPVQPMKAIAAVAIAEYLLPSEIAAAGLIVGAIIFVLGSTGLIEKINKIIPMPVIRGIQLGIGLKIIIKGFSFIKDLPWLGYDSIIAALMMGVTVIILKKVKKFPSALLLFISGLVILYVLHPTLIDKFSFSLPLLSIVEISKDSWINGFYLGALPQIPLTLLNSVFAICVLSGDLFPGQQISARKMSTSVGLMNLIGCWFGAMPMCHGSGGLAGQYHFGARTGGSVVLLGIGKLLFGLFLGVYTMKIIQLFPFSILGVMLLFAGIELALPARDQNNYIGFMVTIITAAGILGLNTIIGFTIGITIYYILSNLTADKYNL
jgi:MFS superfamily sulfate permease-like transporter